MEGGSVQVGLLHAAPPAAARKRAAALCPPEDALRVLGREVYWRPRGRMSDSSLDLEALQCALGPMTMRTRRTLERLAARLLGEA